jgi:hypothetical protein
LLGLNEAQYNVVSNNGAVSMSNAVKKTWIVTISGERPIQAVANDLKDAGFDVHDVLPYVGSVVGHGTEDVAERLKGISGVSDVSPEHAIEIGPPGADIS